MGQDFDLFVIGAGSGGVRAARMAAQRGARVAVAEPAPLGGTCVNLGCIPKKLYSEAAHFGEGFEQARGFGWTSQAHFDWATLKTHRAAEITRLNGVYGNLLRNAGVRLVEGRATIPSPGRIEVGGAVHRAAHTLIATGAKPVALDIPGGEFAVTSDQMFDLPVFPRRLVVIGGGYIACEFASIFRGLGAQVTQLVRAERPLRGFDEDVRRFLAAEMAKKGVRQRFGTAPVALARRADGTIEVTLGNGDVLEADVVLQAVGRRPNSAGLGLAEAGVALDAHGAIVVDEGFETSVKGLHAVGDVVGRMQLTPVALAEAMVVVDRLFGGGTRRMDYADVPTAVFTHPNIGTVGLTEAQARERHGAVRIFRSEFRPLKHTLSGSGERMLVKLVVEAAGDRVVGVHVVGEGAGEIVQGFAVALKAGATKAQFDATIGIHPTAAEELVTLREPVPMA